MTKKQTNTKNSHMILIMVIYLAGIFMGAIDTGIVTPARTVIQNTLNVDAQYGVWMITIYTLGYAASIPIMGKIADKHGRKPIYLFSITLFGLGSLLSGLSQFAGSFTLLLISRAIQAIGGGGIMPIATAEFGTTFPKEKRGVALGLVGGVYGIANIFGASAGSLILDIFGQSNWAYIFFINIPITIVILGLGLLYLPNSKTESVKKIDILGILFLTATILTLLYGLKSIDFLDFWNSLISLQVYPFIFGSILLTFVFLHFEKKAQDPVLHLEYFKDKQILITLILSFMSGFILMGIIFVPQFAETAVRIPSGSGGYFVIVLGLFAGIGAPLSGRLIDKFGVKPILGFGFGVSAIAGLFMITIVIPDPTMFKVIIGLMLIGLGMGFSLGTPLNYMMLENTAKENSNSALATLSLFRSIGTTIAPSIMVAFIASSGMLVQGNIVKILPPEMTLPSIVYAEELDDTFSTLPPSMIDGMGDFSFSDYANETTYLLEKPGNEDNSNIELDPEALALMKSSDITNIAKNTVTFYESLFESIFPPVVQSIQDNIQTGIDSIPTNIADTIPETMNQLSAFKDDVPNAFDVATSDYLDDVSNLSLEIENVYQETLFVGFTNIFLTTMSVAIVAFIVLRFYKQKID